MPLFIIILLSTTILILIVIVFKKEKEKNELFHVMAHRFRSPIAIVRWYVELISDKSVGTLNDKQRKYLSEIDKASEKLNETIGSLLVLLQLQSNKLFIKIQTTNIKDLIDQILQKMTFKVERHRLHLQVDYPQNQGATIQTDPKLLTIVLQNLIESAIKYTPENGNIGIRVDMSNNKKLFLEIKGDGYEIPKEGRSRILSSSVNSKDAELSLYLVKHLLKKLGGKISFKSEENKKAIFYVSLPS